MTKNNEFEWGKKMIKLSVHFWTNDLPKNTDRKTAWGSGAIHVVANKGRNLEHNHIFFNNFDEFLPKMAELLKRNNIKLIRPPEKFEEIDLMNVGKPRRSYLKVNEKCLIE